ncbi:MAG: YicC/YloC family endoribonuclease [Pikeienuella sp.]
MRSMTGFASEVGEARGRRWRWEIKSVNGRGLDLRFRLADQLGVDEAGLRAIAGKYLSRGSVTVQLWEDAARDVGALHLNEAALTAVVAALEKAENAADAAGVSLAPSCAADILAIRGVMEVGAAPLELTDDVKAAVVQSFEAALAKLATSRAEEGQRQQETLGGLIDQIQALCRESGAVFDEQQDGVSQRLATRLADLTETEVDPARLAQEVALIAVKGDVREELDRLQTHIAAARDLVAEPGPVGRKLDFLTQEFNREVNTLCSKSGSAELTRVGLEMKVIVDQVREQAQNVE